MRNYYGGSHVRCGLCCHPNFLIWTNSCERPMNSKDSERKVLQQYKIHRNDSVFIWKGFRPNTTHLYGGWYSIHFHELICHVFAVFCNSFHTRRPFWPDLRSMHVGEKYTHECQSSKATSGHLRSTLHLTYQLADLTIKSLSEANTAFQIFDAWHSYKLWVYTHKFSSYLAENTVRLHYKSQQVNHVKRD